MSFLASLPNLFFTYIDTNYLDYSQQLSLYSLINKHPNYTINIFTSSINLEKNHYSIFKSLNIKPIILNVDKYLNLTHNINYQDKIELFKIKFINKNGGIWITLNLLWILNINNSLNYVNQSYSYCNTFKLIHNNQKDLNLSLNTPFSLLESVEEQLEFHRNKNEYFIINFFNLESYIKKKNNQNNKENEDINYQDIKNEVKINIIEDFILIGSKQSEVFQLLEETYLKDIEKFNQIQSNTFQNVVIEYFMKKIINKKTVNTNFISIESFNPFYQDLPKLLFNENFSFNKIVEYFNNVSCIFWDKQNDKVNQIIEKNHQYYLKNYSNNNFPCQNSFWTILNVYHPFKKIVPYLDISNNSILNISKKLFCFIIPFRDRYPNLRSLIECLKEFKIKYPIDFDLYLINQANNQLFNRGKLFNIGFLEIGKSYDYIYLGDCDALPNIDQDRFDQRLMNQKFKPYTNFDPVNQVSHLSSFLEQWNYIIEAGDSKLSTIKCTPFDYLKTEHCGGSILVKNNFFTKINGFSNLYEGWGGEDNDLGYRIMTNIDEKKVKSEIINFLNKKLKNINIINTHQLANLRNVEYSIYQFLNLILSESPYPNIRKEQFFEQIKKYKFTYNNFDYKIPPGVYFNRRPCLFKDSKHHNQEKKNKRLDSKHHHNPNYENNFKKISEIRNKFYSYQNLTNDFLSDGLNNCYYQKNNQITYTYQDFKFDVINVDFKSENLYQKISVIINFNYNLNLLRTNLNLLESFTINSDLLEVILIHNSKSNIPDNSDTNIDLSQFVNRFSYQIKIINYESSDNNITTGQILNYSLSQASGDLIIVQFSEIIYNFDLGVNIKAFYNDMKNMNNQVLLYKCYLDHYNLDNNYLDEDLNLNSINKLINSLQDSSSQIKIDSSELQILAIPSKIINIIHGFDERLNHVLDCLQDIILRVKMIDNCQINQINNHQNLIFIPKNIEIILNNYQPSEILIQLKDKIHQGLKFPNWKKLHQINNLATYYNSCNYNFDYNLLMNNNLSINNNKYPLFNYFNTNNQFYKLYYKMNMINNCLINIYHQSTVYNFSLINNLFRSNHLQFESIVNYDFIIFQNSNNIFEIFFNNQLIYTLEEYDNIEIYYLGKESENTYRVSINIPLSINDFSQSNFDNLDCLFNKLSFNSSYQYNIGHIDSQINNEIKDLDQKILLSNFNYIFVHKNDQLLFNLGYTRNLCRFLNLSKNLIISDVDMPIPHFIINEVIQKLNEYQVVSPYQNKILYTSPESKKEWLDYPLLDDNNNYKAFIDKYKHQVNPKRLFTLSGGITAFSKKVYDYLGGYSEVNGYGFEDRFTDSHILYESDKIKYYHLNLTSVHLFHDSQSKEKNIKNINKIKQFNQKYYNCLSETYDKCYNNIHQLCQHHKLYMNDLRLQKQSQNFNLRILSNQNKYLNSIILKPQVTDENLYPIYYGNILITNEDKYLIIDYDNKFQPITKNSLISILSLTTLTIFYQINLSYPEIIFNLSNPNEKRKEIINTILSKIDYQQEYSFDFNIIRFMGHISKVNKLELQKFISDNSLISSIYILL